MKHDALNFYFHDLTDLPKDVVAGRFTFNASMREGKLLRVVIELPEHVKHFVSQLPQVNGFQMSLYTYEEKQFCSLSIRNNELSSTFEEIITLACKSAAQASNAHNASSAFFKRLDQYIKFLKPNPRGVLNERSVIGLLGELHLLDGGTDLNISVTDFIHSWTGPDQAPQDFIFDEPHNRFRAIEVKTIGGTNSNIIHINGLDQLDANHFGELLLVIFRIEARTTDGITLPEKIHQISEKIKGADAEKFEERLLTCGYHSIDADKYPHRFRISSYNIYRIDDQTPALTRSRIPPGITNARYEIEISSIRNLTEPANTTWGSKK